MATAAEIMRARLVKYKAADQGVSDAVSKPRSAEASAPAQAAGERNLVV